MTPILVYALCWLALSLQAALLLAHFIGNASRFDAPDAIEMLEDW